MKKEKEKTYYHDLCDFTAKWLDDKNKKGQKPNMSEIVGGLEMMKNEFYFTQDGWMSSLAIKTLKGQLKNLMKTFKDSDISIHSDGSISITKRNFKDVMEND